MKKIVKRSIKSIGLTILSIMLLSGCAQTTNNTHTTQPIAIQPTDVHEKQLYTAYNIWRMKPYNMKCINYKKGYDILPAGTKVHDVEIYWDSQIRKNMIAFKSAEDNRSYNIWFTKNWHPGKTIEDYRKLMFTTNNFDQMTIGMNEEEITAIIEGTIVDGMSKNAVLISYGYPPEHRTRSLSLKGWIYQRNKFAQIHVCFDKNDRTIRCR